MLGRDIKMWVSVIPARAPAGASSAKDRRVMTESSQHCLSDEVLACPLGLCPCSSLAQKALVSLKSPLPSDIQRRRHLLHAATLAHPTTSRPFRHHLALQSPVTEQCHACWPVFSPGAGANSSLSPPNTFTVSGAFLLPLSSVPPKQLTPKVSLCS